MTNDSPGLRSPILVAAAITLLVTIVRVVGELQGWDPRWFGSDAGGGGAIIGITWLLFVFGFWFGWRIKRTASAPIRAGRAAALYLLAVAVIAGGGFGLIKAGLVVFPTEEAPGELHGLSYLLMLMVLGALIALLAWPRLTAALMLYGALARLPVVVVTYLAITRDWNTHYTKLPPGAQVTDTMEKFWALSIVQMTWWPFVFTPVVGGLCGCLGAVLARGRSR